jgi:hydrogenase maturation protease
MNTLVLGLGNPILSDDGVGLKVVQKLRNIKPPLEADFKETAIAGLSILDEVDGYKKLIVVDSIKTGKDKPGSIYKLKPENFSCTTQLSNSHGIDFFTALKFGKECGYTVPEEIHIFAVEVLDNTTFSEYCTPDVEASVSMVVQKITEEVT